MKTFVLGDIHGGHKALLQCLERSDFNKEKDELIFLGDAVDGWPQTKEVLEELMTIKNLIFIRGNHDDWAIGHYNTGEIPQVWASQGGMATLKSMSDADNDVIEFLKNKPVNIYSKNNKLFVHASYDDNVLLEEQTSEVLMWDRFLWNNRATQRIYGKFEEIYVGHTSIWHQGFEHPTKFGNVWFMDTGGGWEGKLSMMDIDSKELFQSDLVSSLYPRNIGRN